MKSVPIFEAKNRLSALIQEVEKTGESITLTRHGRPVARLTAASKPRTAEERAAAWRQSRLDRDRLAREWPASAQPLAWEEIKADIEESL
jgi:prevent-host-death family protein